MPEISVIIPVFNARRYLDRCIDSLLAQTTDDLELIFVDDHGSDGSMDIAVRRKSEYTGGKTFVFTRPPRNSGPGGARNEGLRTARGRYVLFVDADDTVSPDFCGKLLRAAADSGADLACCDISVGEEIHRNPDVSDRRYFLRHFVSYFTTFIYRREMLLEYGITFPETGSAEDTCFLTCCLLASKRTVQIHEVLYRYIVNDESVSRRRNRGRARQRLASFRHLLSFARRYDFFRKWRPEILLIVLKKGYALSLKDLILG